MSLDGQSDFNIASAKNLHQFAFANKAFRAENLGRDGFRSLDGA